MEHSGPGRPAEDSDGPGPFDVARSIYAQFMHAFATNPSGSSITELAESITGCSVAVTDTSGAVVSSSAAFDGTPHIDPPWSTTLTDGPQWATGAAVATPIADPGRYYIWFFGDVDPSDVVQRIALTCTSEFTFLVKSFAFPGIPTSWLERGHLLERMLRGGDIESIAADAERLGYSIEREAYIVAIEPQTGMNGTRLGQLLGSRIHRFGILTTRDNRVIVGVFDGRELDDLLSTLGTIHDTGPFRIGVSARQPNGFDLRRAYDQAISMVSRPSRNGATVMRFEEQDPVTLLTDIADEDSVHLFISRSIGPLLEYERIHQGELLRTLCTWVEWTGSLDALAAKLHIHKSTLVYRIRRIKELLDDDLADGGRRFEIGLALRLLGQVERRAGTDLSAFD